MSIVLGFASGLATMYGFIWYLVNHDDPLCWWRDIKEELRERD